MRFGRSITARRRRTSRRGWNQAFAALALFLFAFQNYVTQTHIHLLWQGAPAAFVQAIGGGAQLQKQAPANQSPADNPANCPICQDLLLVGHFTSPAAITLFLPALVALPVATILATPVFVAATSHDWQGRAPPRA